MRGQLVEQRVALVEQVVGRLVGACVRGCDLVVEIRDALGERRDLGRFAGDRGFDLLGEPVELRVVGLQAIRQSVRLAQHDLAGR